MTEKPSVATPAGPGRTVGILGLFPALEATGGVQASGKLAWQAITQADDPAFGERYFISHGLNGHASPPADPDRSLVVSSRLGAAVAALGRSWPVSMVLVWHMDLLKYLLLLRLSRARTVLFLHGIEAWRHPNVAMRLLLRRVDLFLSNSDHTWNRFVTNYPAVRSAPRRTVHLGVGVPARGEIAAPSHTPIAVMIGRLVRSEGYKGHREVIDAWPQVVERVPGAELWIIGDGDLRPDLEATARQRGVTGYVRFLGALPDAAKDEALIRSRCLLMPSRGEGFGLVYLEAMRVGRPCLVSTLDAGREVVNPPEAGLAVDPADLRQVVEAVSRLLTPGQEWESWSVRARQRYEERFTAAHFEQRLVRAVSEMVESNGTAA